MITYYLSFIILEQQDPFNLALIFSIGYLIRIDFLTTGWEDDVRTPIGYFYQLALQVPYSPGRRPFFFKNPFRDFSREGLGLKERN